MNHPPISEHVDVLILGAGLSRIGAAARLTQEHPPTRRGVLRFTRTESRHDPTDRARVP